MVNTTKCLFRHIWLVLVCSVEKPVKVGKVCQKLTIVGVVSLFFIFYNYYEDSLVSQDHARGMLWLEIKENNQIMTKRMIKPTHSKSPTKTTFV